MSSTGVDLLLRVVAGQLADERCLGCRRLLSDPRLTVREQRVDSIAVDVACRNCGQALVLEVKPEPDGGVARVR